ncbi:MAG: DEAD/DEAH box helicase family protein [Singulisphaera sp.]
MAAGWDVGAEGSSTEAVGQESRSSTSRPQRQGQGRLRPLGLQRQAARRGGRQEDGGRCRAGRTQAKCYADGLEKMSGQRPVIFYTNGHDVWIWNDARASRPASSTGSTPRTASNTPTSEGEPRADPKTAPDPKIAGWMFQIETIKRVAERFAARHRKALIVQATGTGKTRVAVSLAELLLRTKWAKRILFLCDRKELRKQAYNVFKEHLPGEPRTLVTSATSKDREKRIYLSTYPSMMECFETFDVGFFDLIIADESHRSIYNRYADLFAYFDSPRSG